MQKLRTVEDSIIRALSDETVSQAFEQMLEFFAVCDYLNNTSHEKIIREIYKVPIRFRKSIVAISMDVHIGERTLIRYRKTYIKCFKFYHDKILIKKEAALAK